MVVTLEQSKLPALLEATGTHSLQTDATGEAVVAFQVPVFGFLLRQNGLLLCCRSLENFSAAALIVVVLGNDRCVLQLKALQVEEGRQAKVNCRGAVGKVQFELALPRVEDVASFLKNLHSFPST
ncbi:hypothetical protein TYRP_011961 [Tyrophagus putrescentiae]|nr:hypothetical protein TYRP_011961 [Tyrophagus putrescentiae]